MSLVPPKPMRMLVYCGSRAAIEKFDMAGWLLLVSQYPAAQRQEIINEFCSTPNARMAVLGPAFAFGWRAPADTAVLFDPSWPFAPDSPENIQAVARVDNPDRWGAPRAF
jgi:hypothetical protein